MNNVTELAISEQSKRYCDCTAYPTKRLTELRNLYEEMEKETISTDIYIKARALRQALNGRS